jgi:hypothetical protein
MKTYIELFFRNSVLTMDKFHFRFTGEKNLYLVIIQISFVTFIQSYLCSIMDDKIPVWSGKFNIKFTRSH